MVTAIPATSGYVILDNIPWAVYEARTQTDNKARLAYTCGVLEIISPSSRHERLSETVKTFLWIVCRQLGIDFEPTASTIFKRSELEKGFEPDASFYES